MTVRLLSRRAKFVRNDSLLLTNSQQTAGSQANGANRHHQQQATGEPDGGVGAFQTKTTNSTSGLPAIRLSDGTLGCAPSRKKSSLRTSFTSSKGKDVTFKVQQRWRGLLARSSASLFNCGDKNHQLVTGNNNSGPANKLTPEGSNNCLTNGEAPEEGRQRSAVCIRPGAELKGLLNGQILNETSYIDDDLAECGTPSARRTGNAHNLPSSSSGAENEPDIRHATTRLLVEPPTRAGRVPPNRTSASTPERAGQDLVRTTPAASGGQRLISDSSCLKCTCGRIDEVAPSAKLALDATSGGRRAPGRCSPMDKCNCYNGSAGGAHIGPYCCASAACSSSSLAGADCMPNARPPGTRTSISGCDQDHWPPTNGSCCRESRLVVRSAGASALHHHDHRHRHRLQPRTVASYCCSQSQLHPYSSLVSAPISAPANGVNRRLPIENNKSVASRQAQGQREQAQDCHGSLAKTDSRQKVSSDGISARQALYG